MPWAWAADIASRHAVTANAARNWGMMLLRVTQVLDVERFTDRTPAPFFVAIADDRGIIVRPPGATCRLHKAAGKESSKAVSKRQIVWPLRAGGWLRPAEQLSRAGVDDECRENGDGG